ncbi:hypothetical protein IU459_11685 [Nocardia amamiensis]|uniref:Uncharacterized protein n=1 Tax=Nocardia amamiensis TaxID=404578 RepID=A0ABS0CNK7_9NOCA|nr:hypothetical protein [Nocardia amamiensis]MBF6298201.1 hypothetical protein [Nocardia amamiensis]
MTSLPAIGNLLVGGGVSTVLVALIVGFFARSTRRSDYARAIVEASGEFADRADRRNEIAEAKLETAYALLDRMRDRLWKFSDLMRAAIPLLQADGHHALARRMQAALDSGMPPPDDPSAG